MAGRSVHKSMHCSGWGRLSNQSAVPQVFQEAEPIDRLADLELLSVRG